MDRRKFLQSVAAASPLLVCGQVVASIPQEAPVIKAAAVTRYTSMSIDELAKTEFVKDWCDKCVESVTGTAGADDQVICNKLVDHLLARDGITKNTELIPAMIVTWIRRGVYWKFFSALAIHASNERAKIFATQPDGIPFSSWKYMGLIHVQLEAAKLSCRHETEKNRLVSTHIGCRLA